MTDDKKEFHTNHPPHVYNVAAWGFFLFGMGLLTAALVAVYQHTFWIVVAMFGGASITAAFDHWLDADDRAKRRTK